MQVAAYFKRYVTKCSNHYHHYRLDIIVLIKDYRSCVMQAKDYEIESTRAKNSKSKRGTKADDDNFPRMVSKIAERGIEIEERFSKGRK